MTWQRGCESGHCVEVRIDRRNKSVYVRDTKSRVSMSLVFDFDEWRRFVEYVKQGAVDV